MADVLFELCDAKAIKSNLYPVVEITPSKDYKKTVVQLVNASGSFGNSYFEPMPQVNINIDLDDIKSVTAVETLNGGEVSYKYDKENVIN